MMQIQIVTYQPIFKSCKSSSDAPPPFIEAVPKEICSFCQKVKYVNSCSCLMVVEGQCAMTFRKIYL